MADLTYNTISWIIHQSIDLVDRDQLAVCVVRYGAEGNLHLGSGPTILGGKEITGIVSYKNFSILFEKKL